MSDTPLDQALYNVAFLLELAGNGKPLGVITAVVRHTAGQPGEENAKRILVGQGAFPADVDELFRLYKEENRV